MIGLWTKEYAQLNSLHYVYQEEMTSTNSFAKTYSHHKDFIILTDLQTQGRGRGKNTWTSPQKGHALLSSWVFQVHFNPQPILAPLIGLAVYKSIQNVFHLNGLSLKAPNDIYLNDKKIGGILIETETQAEQIKIIVGIGLNIFSSPNVEVAGCLQAGINERIDICQFHGVLIDLHKNLKDSIQYSKHSELTTTQSSELLSALNEHSLLKEKYTSVLPDGSLKTSHHVIPWYQI
jgi:BirA family biotin operon repressor/biotin-[acetyl-CoA-carboxylase] ligase